MAVQEMTKLVELVDTSTLEVLLVHPGQIRLMLHQKIRLMLQQKIRLMAQLRKNRGLKLK